MSFWKCLCLPHRKSRTHSERRKWQNHGCPASLSMQSTSKSKLLQHSDHEFGFDTERISTPVEDTWSKLENQPGIKKRRRLDDIFDRPKSEIVKSSRNSQNFKSVGYPCLVTPHVESMYGYTPRAVQDVYASSALEGGAIEDYFTDCRNDSNLNRFASSTERCDHGCESSLEETNMTFSLDTGRKYVVHNSEGDYSSDSDMEAGDFEELFPETIKYRDVFPISPFKESTDLSSGYLCQSEHRECQIQHFEEIFDGEVLY